MLLKHALYSILLATALGRRHHLIHHRNSEYSQIPSNLSSTTNSTSTSLPLPALGKLSNSSKSTLATINSSTSILPAVTIPNGLWSGNSTLEIMPGGGSGVAAMQLSVVENDLVLIFDKAELNPLQINGHSSWAATYDLSTGVATPIDLHSNSFCAGGSSMGNGSFVSVGGNSILGVNMRLLPYDSNGSSSLRFFNSTTKQVQEFDSIYLQVPRWYASVLRVTDGSLMIIGGDKMGGFTNNRFQANNDFEFFPSKGPRQKLQFLTDALPTNLFPIAIQLPDGTIFMAASSIAMIYNPETSVERRLADIPSGVVYPASAVALLLPLTIANNFTPEILICGGTTADVTLAPNTLSYDTPASTQCVRMVLNEAGIAKGWIIEQMDAPRIMGDGIITPDGKVIIINGAKTGVAGFGNIVKNSNTPKEIGQSNAGNPKYQATLYDPTAKAGARFTNNFPSSQIERLYHSVATLIPDGRIMITGSNPNGGVSSKQYATRYEVEMLSPPYMFLPRPSFTQPPSNILYDKVFTLATKIPASAKIITAVIIDLGYATHGVHMNQRSVELVVIRYGNNLAIRGPTSSGIYPPGYGWLHILADGVPAKGMRVMVGDGSNPPSL